MNKNKISIVLLFSGLFFGSCKTSKNADCDAYGYNDIKSKDTTIVWDDYRVSYIGVSYPNGLEMPKIPVNKSNKLHINDLVSGTYKITFESDTEILFTKTINVSN